jgi:hypothetical protein
MSSVPMNPLDIKNVRSFKLGYLGGETESMDG